LDQSGLLYRSLERAFAAGEETVGFNPGTPFVRADELTDRAIEWATSPIDSNRFMWVHYMDVHHPYSPPEEFQLEFRDSPVSERRAVKLRRKMLEDPAQITDSELSTLIDLYDGEIRFVDHEVKRLVETVRTEWESDPVVVFTSDHGDEFLDHGGFSHLKTLYDELLHVPLLFYDGDESGSYDDVVELIDVPATLISYADADVPSTYEGRSLESVIDGTGKEKDYAICDAGDTFSYRSERWKYIERPDTVELYDVLADPDERNDLAADRPDVVEELSAFLESHREKAASTDEDLEAIEIGGEVQDRLEQLGYLQE
jgi:arylsulfatase A-like enzyme